MTATTQLELSTSLVPCRRSPPRAAPRRQTLLTDATIDERWLLLALVVTPALYAEAER